MTRRRLPHRRWFAATCLLLPPFLTGVLPSVLLRAQSPAAGTSVTADRAAERYRQLLAANPAEGVALDRLWQAAEGRGVTAALIEEYRLRAAESAGDGPGAFAAALVHGHLLKKAGRPDEALDAYHRAGTLDPASPLPPLAVAALHNARGEPVRAAEALEEALGKIPAENTRRRADALLQLGAARQAAGDPVRAADAWERAVALAPSDLSLRERLAAASEAAGDLPRAAGHWEFIATHASAPEARALAARALGRVRAAAGDFDAARDALARGLALAGPGNWLRGDFQRALIALHARAGRLPELETRWRQEADKAPRDPGARLQLAEFYRQTGQAAGERAALETVVVLLPRAREPALRLARLLADTENPAADLPRAAGLLDGLLKAQPGNFDLLLARATLDLRAGRPAEAAARVEAAVTARPDDETLGAAALGFFNAHRLTDATERLLRGGVARHPDAEESAFALASFLFVQRQPDAARAVLDALLTRRGSGATAADVVVGRLARAADLCRTHGDTDGALRFARRAADAAPDDAARRLALADAELAAGDTDAARRDFLRAADLAPDPEEAERRLFATFQPPPGANPETVRRMDDDARRFQKELEKASDEYPLAAGRLARWLLARRQFSEALTVARAAAAAAAAGSVPWRELLVRAATEAGDRTLAADTLEELAAADQSPTDRVRHRRALARIRLEDGDADAALVILGDLARENPGSREILTDLALTQQRAERWEEALATWEKLLALPGLPPGARAEVRRPLVAVLLHLGQHGRALEFLDGALDAAGGTSDANARAGLFREALAVAAEHGLLDRFAARAEARGASARSGDATPLVELAEVRRQQGREQEADDLLERAALAAPDPAVATAPGGPLLALVDAAERRGDADGAVARQERIVTLAGPDAGVEVLARLAELRAATGDFAGAARAWDTLAVRFPRDPAALARAAAFFEGPEGDDAPRARELLALAAALEPGDVARQLRFGALAAAAGDVPAARAAFGTVLDHTTAETPGDTVELPPETSLSPFGSTAGGSSSSAVVPVREERRQRLAAVRGLAGLPMSPDERGRFLERWRAEAARAPGEALWAGHFAGAPELALDVLAGLVVARPEDERLPRLFVWWALRAGDGARLGQFLRPAGADDRLLRRRRDVALESLRAFLPTVRDWPTFSADLLAAFFPENGTSRETLWRAAAGIFAPQGRFAEAAMLGERALARTASGRAAVAVTLARWQLVLGRSNAARDSLRLVLEDLAPYEPSSPSSSLLGDGEDNHGTDDPDGDEGAGQSPEGSDATLEAVCALHALLPAPERAPFREAIQARCAGWPPARTAELRALLAGLAGDHATARTAVTRLVALQPLDEGRTSGRFLSGSPGDAAVTDARRGSFLLAAGRRFENRGLDDTAGALWTVALATAAPTSVPGIPGFPGNGDREGPWRELRDRLARRRFLDAAGDPTREGVAGADFLRAGPPVEAVVNLVHEITDAGLPRAAARLAAEAARRSPVAGSELGRAELRARQAAGDFNAAESLVRGASGRGDGPLVIPADPTAPSGPAMALADFLERAGDLPAARRVLENAVAAGPRDPGGALGIRLATAREKLGMLEPAAEAFRAVLRANPALAPARVSLADLEDRLGRPERAVTVLAEGLPPTPTPPALPLTLALVRRDLAAGRPERPVELARRYLRAGQPVPAVNVAESFAEKNVVLPAIRASGRRLMAAAFHAARDGQTRFTVQATLVERFCDPRADRADFDRELRRLGRVAQATPVLRPAWEAARYRLLAERWPDLAGELAAQLRREDSAPADARLIALTLRDPARSTAADLAACAERLARRERVDVSSLHDAVLALDAAGRAAHAVPLAARLTAFLSQKGDLARLHARVRWRAGDHDGATAILAGREALGFFEPGETLAVASLWEELGELDRARDVLRHAIERLPGPRPGSWRLALARLELGRGDLPAARPLLRAALADPAVTDFTPALDYLEARRTLADPAGWGDVAPTEGIRARLFPATFDRLVNRERWEDVRRLLAARPAFLLENSTVATRLRAAMETSRDPSGITASVELLENVLAQAGGHTPVLRLAHELARLLDLRADVLLSPSSGGNGGDPEAALAALRRANDLEPADWARAQRLAKLLAARGDAPGAAGVVQGFLACPDAAAPEKEEARQRLTLVQR